MDACDDPAASRSQLEATPDHADLRRWCERCRRGLGPRGGCRFALDGGQSTLRCLRCAVRFPAVVRRAVSTSLIVGTLLTAINQGDVFLHGPLTATLLWKLPLTYLAPFSVSMYSAIAISRVLR
jgi:hypothetical protein